MSLLGRPAWNLEFKRLTICSAVGFDGAGGGVVGEGEGGGRTGAGEGGNSGTGGGRGSGDGGGGDAATASGNFLDKVCDGDGDVFDCVVGTSDAFISDARFVSAAKPATKSAMKCVAPERTSSATNATMQVQRPAHQIARQQLDVLCGPSSMSSSSSSSE